MCMFSLWLQEGRLLYVYIVSMVTGREVAVRVYASMVTGRQVAVRVYCFYGYRQAGCCMCMFSLWLQEGRLLYVYIVSMVTGRQVAVRVYCFYGYRQTCCCTLIMSLVYCLHGYREADYCTCILFLWWSGRQVGVRVYCFYGGQGGRLVYVYIVSMVVREAGWCTCILFLWLQGGRLLYVYFVSMVTGREVAVRVYCFYGYREGGCCTCILFLWWSGRQVGVRVYCFYGGQGGRLVYVYIVSMVVREAGWCTCILFLWLQGGRLLYVYIVSMVTGRQVPVRVYCFHGYREASCCTLSMSLHLRTPGLTPSRALASSAGLGDSSLMAAAYRGTRGMSS